ncbi:MAG TPA: zinc ribbon domain-containing protein [Gaiellaceae bacterium]|nr:zinc ribbon domain-containing protein [Gaiellaceae bacterium]
MPWVRRPRRDPHEPGVGEPPASELPAHLAPLPPPGRMRRERRFLARRRETEIRDVGGLTVEMVRRDRFRPELLIERAGDVLSLEERMLELDGLLLAAAAVPRGTRAVQLCACGGPLLPGAHFCSHCGRPAGGVRPVATCSHCGGPLPADVNFCPACGHSVAADDFVSDTDDLGQTLIGRWSAGEEE